MLFDHTNLSAALEKLYLKKKKLEHKLQSVHFLISICEEMENGHDINDASSFQSADYYAQNLKMAEHHAMNYRFMHENTVFSDEMFPYGSMNANLEKNNLIQKDLLIYNPGNEKRLSDFRFADLLEGEFQYGCDAVRAAITIRMIMNHESIEKMLLYSEYNEDELQKLIEHIEKNGPKE